MCTKACSSLSCLTNERDSCWQLRLTTPKFCLADVDLFLVCLFAVPNPLFNFNFVMQAQQQVVKQSTARGLCSGVECFQQQWSCLCLGTVVLQLCCQSSLPATGVADTQSWSAAVLPCYMSLAAYCCCVTSLPCQTVAVSQLCSVTRLQDCIAAVSGNKHSQQWWSSHTLKVSRICAQLHCSIHQLHATLISNDVQRLQKLLHAQSRPFNSKTSWVLFNRAQHWS